MKKIHILILVSFGLAMVGCSSGGSSDESLLFRGQLTQGESAAHHKDFNFKHSANQPIEEVQICALGKCSTTDIDGEWGFTVNHELVPQQVSFTINGHGINTTTLVSMPAGSVKESSDIFIHFQHVNGIVQPHHIEVE